MSFLIFLMLLNYAIFIIARITNTDPFDYYDPKRWRSFYIWLLKLQLRYLGENSLYLKRHELVQYSYRTMKCIDCVRNGRCKECGCDTIGRMNNITDTCSALKWGAFLEEEEFNEIWDDPNFIFDVDITEKFKEEE